MIETLKMNVSLILFDCKLVIGMFVSENIDLISLNNHDTSYTDRIKFKKFRLTRKEINEFYASMNRLKKMIEFLQRNIIYFHHEVQSKGFCIDSLSSVENWIDFLFDQRMNFESFTVFEYEFLKFHELFYLTMYYIIKHRNKLELGFFQFSKSTVLPILNEMKIELNFNKFHRIYDLLEEILHIRKITHEDKRHSLLNFLGQFLENHNNIISIEQINENCTLDGIISQCFNFFVKCYMYHRSKIVEYQENFMAQKYPISNQFADFLFCSGEITEYMVDLRIKLREFSSKYKLNVETRFLQQDFIPRCFENVNEDSIISSISEIDCVESNN